MLYQAPIGDITFYTTPLPRRHCSRSVFITTRYSQLYVAIQTASNPAQARAVARQTLLELTPLYEGVSIIAFLEKALSPHNPSSSKEDENNKMPITMDELEDILDARGLVTEAPSLGGHLSHGFTNRRIIRPLTTIAHTRSINT